MIKTGYQTVIQADIRSNFLAPHQLAGKTCTVTAIQDSAQYFQCIGLPLGYFFRFLQRRTERGCFKCHQQIRQFSRPFDCDPLDALLLDLGSQVNDRRFTFRYRPEIFFSKIINFPCVNISHDYQCCIVWHIPLPIPVTHFSNSHFFQIIHPADDGLPVRTGLKGG